MAIYAGIDPGVSGGLAVIVDKGLANAWPIPTYWYAKPTPKNPGGRRRAVDFVKLRQMIVDCGATHVMVERQWARPGDPKGGGGALLLTNYGKTVGLLIGLGLQYGTVSPQRWVRMTVGLSKDRTKEDNIRCARMRYPLTDLGRGKGHDGMADALLIAHVGMMGAEPWHVSIADTTQITA